MHQSTLRSPRSLAPRRFHHSPRQRRPLPLLRRLPPQRSPAARPALPHAPPLPHRAPAPPTPSALTSEVARIPLLERSGTFPAYSASISSAAFKPYFPMDSVALGRGALCQMLQFVVLCQNESFS